MRKIIRTSKFLLVSSALCSALLFTVSCNKNNGADSAMNMQLEVKTALVKKEDATVLKKYTASLQGKVNVEVRAQASGYVEKIVVDEGSYVKKGQPILLIDAQPYKIQLNNANASLKAAKATLETAQLEKDKVASLLENSFVSPIQLKTANAAYDNALANVAQAEAAVAEAQLNLNYCTVKAPVDGYLGRISKRVGNLVTAGEAEALTTMSDISDMYAYFSISEADYYNLVSDGGNTTAILNMPVELELTNGTRYDKEGKIDMLNGEFDKTTNSLSVRATFPNEKRLLRNGGTGIVNLMTTHNKVIQIPIAATIDLQDKIFAFVLKEDNTVEQRQLKIIGKNLHTYFIENGVNEAETIVTTGIDKLQDGMQVSPLSAVRSEEVKN